jgi:hypothetical protein
MRKPTEITRASAFSGKLHTLTLDIDPVDYAQWQQGMLIQVALPYLNADEREFLISGVTPEEWNDMFGGFEE